MKIFFLSLLCVGLLLTLCVSCGGKNNCLELYDASGAYVNSVNVSTSYKTWGDLFAAYNGTVNFMANIALQEGYVLKNDSGYLAVKKLKSGGVYGDYYDVFTSQSGGTKIAVTDTIVGPTAQLWIKART